MSPTMSDSLVAIFRDRSEADKAIGELQTAGVSRNSINVHDAAGSSTSGFWQSVQRFFSGDSTLSDKDVVVSVDGADRSRVLPILTRYGARISDEGYPGSKDATGSAYGREGISRGDDARVRLHEERLQVDKQSVKAGEVRLGKDVITEQQNFDVPVTREEVVVERRPLSQTAAVDAGQIGEEEEMSIPVMREEVGVSKRTVATEDVEVSKRQVQETQTVGGTVRKEQARIEGDPKLGTDETGKIRES